MFMLKINFKKLKKYIILIYFKTKNTLKYNIYHTPRTLIYNLISLNINLTRSSSQ
jgi:hypothetical protein